MSSLHHLGAAFAVVLLPAALGAQGRIVGPPPPAGPIGVTLPSPPPPRHEPRSPHVDDLRRGYAVGGGWSYPVVVGTTYQAAPQPVPYPVPVPVYYPAPAARAERPAPPPIPYDPTRARSVMIGRGGDGGAGVMRLERTPGDSLQVTWRGPVRPVRAARLYLADSLHHSVVARPVSAARPRVTFALRRLPSPAAFVGLDVTYADGSRHTTLVPLDASDR
ncbi:MAG: hypothetical protein IT361_01645 [Gemmatimonadaceae bacterium]|nr:hypothetical protein [Gemmatimonadaceae bacterium]